MSDYTFTPTAQNEGDFGWWLMTATDAQRAQYPFFPHPDAAQIEVLRAQWIAHHSTPPVPVVVSALTWPFCEIAPATMQVGTRYAFSFTAGADYSSKSISIAEYQAAPMLRHFRIATDSQGNNILPDAQGQPGEGYGIAGTLIFGTAMGQIPLTIGGTYYFVVDMVGPNGQPSGPVGANATAVVVLR